MLNTVTECLLTAQLPLILKYFMTDFVEFHLKCMKSSQNMSTHIQMTHICMCFCICVN